MNSKLLFESNHGLYQENRKCTIGNITYYWLNHEYLDETIILAVDYGIRYGEAKKEENKITIPVSHIFEKAKSKVMKVAKGIYNLLNKDEKYSEYNEEDAFEEYLKDQNLLITKIE